MSELPPVEPPGRAQTAFDTQIRISYRLGYLDFLDRMVTSRRTWALIILMVTVLSSPMWLYPSTNPPAHSVNSNAPLSPLYFLPFLFATPVVAILFWSVFDWYSQRSHLISQVVALTEESINLASSNGTSVLPWSTSTHYKETRWSFILWNRRGWLLLPKRAFASASELRSCSELIARHLRRTHWFH